MQNELPNCIQKFISNFENFDLSSVDTIDEFYHEEITFKDPIHQVNGIKDLKKYFESLNKNLESALFDFSNYEVTSNNAYMRWTMKLSLKKPKKSIEVQGISILTFDTKITQQQDYFDMGAMVYEHIPLLGGLIRGIKKKMAV